MVATVIILTSTTATTWTVPPDWNNSSNIIHLIGGGGGGGGGTSSVGGAGGGYTKITNFVSTPGTAISYTAGAGGPGASTAAGTAGTATTFSIYTANGGQATGTGGAAVAITGLVTASFAGGTGNTNGGGGGAGPYGVGGTAAAGLGGVGDNTRGGAGTGGAGTEIAGGVGSGGGGNGANQVGGLFGGGGGKSQVVGGTGSAGGQGVIIIVYITPGSGFSKDDPIFGTIDLDDEYITDSWLIDRYVGNQLWGMGLNTYGALGNGNTANYSSPVQVGALTTWQQIACGYFHNTAIKTDGTLWTWGYNNYGQLGINSASNTVYYSSPVQVGALTTWKQVTASQNNSYGITKAGQLYSWGFTNVGQLGINVNSASVYYSSPVQVGSLTNWKQVTVYAAGAHVAAIKTDGTLWAWGQNNYGQLGNGVAGVTAAAGGYYSSPVQVGALTTWKQVFPGNGFAAAIKTDGTLWTWGWNGWGQLGINTSSATVYYSSPVQVGALTNWKYVECGGSYVLATKTDGTLWAWGNNSTGQLGINNIVYYSSPVQVGALSNWKMVSSVASVNLAVKNDGTLWTWGLNQYGQLGNNIAGSNAAYYSSPIQIGSLTNWKYVSAGNHAMAITFTDLTT